MSNIDKQALQAVADLKAGYILGQADVVILNELTRIALASLEAEPAGVVRHIELRGPEHPAGIHVSLYSRLDDGIELYTAPPAQVVPDMAAVGEMPFLGTQEKAFVSGWNACRTAMPQSFGNSEQLNSPVIPDGWVACSERMPDDEEDVLCFGQYGDNDIDEERYQFMGWLSSKGIKGIWRVSDGDSQNRRARVTHWMPLPAAPQQEAKNV